MKITTRGTTMTSTTASNNDQPKALNIQNQIVNFMPKFATSLALRLEALEKENSHLFSFE
jgi:hypothetical protein